MCSAGGVPVGCSKVSLVVGRNDVTMFGTIDGVGVVCGGVGLIGV